MDGYLSDIIGQGPALRLCLGRYQAEEYRKALEGIGRESWREALFIGMGSSNHCAHSAALSLIARGIPSRVESASEFLHYERGLLREGVLPILISQSGESAEISRIIESLPAGERIAGITNEASSSLGRRSTWLFPMACEAEESVSTRTYLASCVLSGLVAEALSGGSTSGYFESALSALDRLDALLADQASMQRRLREFLGVTPYVLAIGRGPGLGTAHAGALFIAECAKFPALGFDAAEFRHGPFEMIDGNFSAFVIAPDGPTFELSVGLARDIASCGGKAVLVAGREPRLDDPRVLCIMTGPLEEGLSPLVDILPIQLFAHYMAEARGLVPGKFKWSSKVTRIE